MNGERESLRARRWIALLSIAALGAACAREPATERALTRLDGTTVAVEAIELRIPEILAAGVVPGLQVAVVRDGRIDYLGAFGVESTASGEPVDEETVFAGLSFSKTVFAYLVMRLVDRGALDLDRPLHGYLPEPLPEYDFYRDLEGDARWQAITARMVLSHTTGWPNWRWLTPENRLAFVFEPGERFSYSGEGFAYLQLVVEEIAGRGLTELAREEVFAPLEMVDTSFVWEERFEESYAVDHDRYARPIGRRRWEEPGAAGSLQTTAADYARFLIAVMESRGLSTEVRDEMLSPQVTIEHLRMFGPGAREATDRYRGVELAWGLGWGLVSTPHGRAHFHTGNDRGSANYTVSFPERGTAVALFGNSNRLESVAPALVRLLIGDEFSPFDFLGYVPYDAPYHEWVRRLVRDGFDAGMRYHAELGDAAREELGLDAEEAFARAGRELLGFGRPQTALALYRAMVARFPESATAREGLARAQLATGRAGEAVASFDQALERVEPGSAAAEHLGWLREWAAARHQPHPPGREDLAALAGTYGPRRVELRDDGLYYFRRDGDAPEPYRLIPMTGETFVMAEHDDFRLRFETDAAGRGVRIIGLHADGDRDETERTD